MRMSVNWEGKGRRGGGEEEREEEREGEGRLDNAI